jgi:hypothetical protein
MHADVSKRRTNGCENLHVMHGTHTDKRTQTDSSAYNRTLSLTCAHRARVRILTAMSRHKVFLTRDITRNRASYLGHDRSIHALDYVAFFEKLGTVSWATHNLHKENLFSFPFELC